MRTIGSKQADIVMPTPHTGWDVSGMLSIFERQVLVFPLLVVVLACTSFLFDGRCAAWQWWTGMAMVVGVPFWKKGGWKASLGAAGLFAGLLVAVRSLLPPLFWDNVYCEDMQVYHLPQIQLLIEGWNPVADPLAEGITAKLGLDLWGMAPLHVAFLPKTMAVFAAVAHQFVGDPTGLTIPGLTFLWLGVTLQVLRQFRGVVRWMVLAALIWVLPMVHWRMYVDLSLAFVSCGLLFSMADAIKHRRCNWVQLGVWTTWLGTIKLNGMIALGVFWCLFAGAIIWRDREHWSGWMSRFALFATAEAILVAIVVWHPYGTSWKKYGHPLYPFATVDKEKIPIKDLTWDLRVGNDDYQSMGRLGLWLYEYVSPQLVKTVYCLKTNRDNFAPTRYQAGPAQWMDCRKRLAFWLLIALLLLHPRGRIWGCGGLLLTIFVQRGVIGYHRYLPWLPALGCLAVALMSETLVSRCGKNRIRLMGGILLGLFFLEGVSWMWHHTRDVAFKAAELSLTRTRIRYRPFADGRDYNLGVNPNDFTPKYNYLTCMENNCRLTVRGLKWENAIILSPNGWQLPKNREQLAKWPMWKWDERQFFIQEEKKDHRRIGATGMPWHEVNVWDKEEDVLSGEGWLLTPWFYYVPHDEEAWHLVEYWRGGEPRKGEGRFQYLFRRMAMVARTWCWTYPRMAWMWFKGNALIR